MGRVFEELGRIDGHTVCLVEYLMNVNKEV